MNFIQDSVFNQKFDYEDDLISIKNYFNDYAKLITSFELCEDENCNISEDSPGCGSETCKTDALYRDFLGINQEQLIELKAKTR